MLPLETVSLPGRSRESVGHLPQRKRVGRTSRALALQSVNREVAMPHQIPAIAIAFVVCTTSAAVAFAQLSTNGPAVTRSDICLNTPRPVN
jgi:hypothetical protein